MEEIRMSYFFLPVLLRVQSNPGGEDVIILKPAIWGTVEFLRLPVEDARRLASLLDAAADNATVMPPIAGQVGEINGICVRAFGTGQVRVRLSVKRSNSVRFAIRQSFGMIGRKTQYNRPKLSAQEARRFANVLRAANVGSK